MNVVCNPADASGRDTVLFGNSAQEWPEPFPQLRVQHRDTLFCAENTDYVLVLRALIHVFYAFLPLASNLNRDRFNRPAGTRGYIPHDSRHFVPGYYRAVPPGQKPFAHRGASQLS